MKKKLLETADLAVGFTKHKEAIAIRSNINLSLLSGEFVCLLGTNGVGKTTLLRTLSYLQPSLRGEVLVEGVPVQKLSLLERARKIAMVMTERPAMGNMSVYDLVALGRYPHTDVMGRIKKKDRAAIHSALESVGAEFLRDRQANEISDGELQKVMVARALAQEPSVLILDEPTNFLDISNRIEMLVLLHSLARESGLAVLMSTHDFELALKTADKIWLMSTGEGVLSGVPEELVLNGHIHTLFKSGESEFDIQTGTLKIHKAFRGQVGLVGEGLPVFWTSRALERAGYDVFPNQARYSVYIEVVQKDKKLFWDLNLEGHKRICASLENLLEVLEQTQGLGL